MSTPYGQRILENSKSKKTVAWDFEGFEDEKIVAPGERGSRGDRAIAVVTEVLAHERYEDMKKLQGERLPKRSKNRLRSKKKTTNSAAAFLEGNALWELTYLGY